MGESPVDELQELMVRAFEVGRQLASLDRRVAAMACLELFRMWLDLFSEDTFRGLIDDTEEPTQVLGLLRAWRDRCDELLKRLDSDAVGHQAE